MPLAERIRKELALLIGDCTEDDSILLAFAGHGVPFRGDLESYFCSADAKLDDKSTLIALGAIYKALEKCSAGLKLLMVDACRNDPRSDTRGRCPGSSWRASPGRSRPRRRAG